jgi:hypothetical protein
VVGLALRAGRHRAVSTHIDLGPAIVAQRMRQLLHFLIQKAHRLMVGHPWQHLGLKQLQKRREIHLRRIFPGAVKIDPHGI